MQYDENHGEKWDTFMNNPTQMWKQRKCNIFMHLIAAICCLISSNESCGIPLSFWLAVQFIFLTLESALMELRERMY